MRDGVTAGGGRTRLIVGMVVALLLLGLGVAALAGPSGGDQHETAATSASVSPASNDGGKSSGLPTVSATDLPAEARRTLTLIQRGGPYPYSRDGVVFGNRERLLPLRNRGYYHEYTVPTPGENDRGARRIVTGDAGERYYTSDHYRSFREVVR